MPSRGPYVRSLTDLADLGRLFQKEEQFLVRYFQRRISPALGSRVGPEDLVNDTYVKLQRNWPDVLKTALSPGHALYRAARECLIEAFRKHKDIAREGPWPERASEELSSAIAASLTTPSQVARRKEITEVVRAVVDSLDDIDREVLELKHFDGLKYKDIADKLGITKDAAMQRHHRALKKLPVEALNGLIDT